MIKINLATKKIAAAVTRTRENAGTGLSVTSFKNLDLNSALDFVREPAVRKFLSLVGLAVVLYLVLDVYQNNQLERLKRVIEKKTAESTKLKQDLAKTSNYNGIKKQIEEDRKLIETKLNTIRKLIADRKIAPQILQSISSEIPKEVWLSNLNLTQDKLALQGSSKGFDKVSDFLKSLGENPYISDIKLADTQRVRDSSAGEVTNFSLEGKRKPE